MADVSESQLLRVYLERRSDLVRFFAARLGSRAAAEDLVQDMYERVLRASETVDNPAAYLYRLGSNLMLDHSRYERRRAARETAWMEMRTVRSGGVSAAVVDEPAADQIVAARQRLAQLMQALEALPPQPRRAFRLHKLDGLSHAETAREMGISRSAVEKHVSAALSLLTAKLGPGK